MSKMAPPNGPCESRKSSPRASRRGKRHSSTNSPLRENKLTHQELTINFRFLVDRMAEVHTVRARAAAIVYPIPLTRRLLAEPHTLPIIIRGAQVADHIEQFAQPHATVRFQHRKVPA